MEIKIKEARFICFLLVFFIINFSCQDRKPTLTPPPGEIGKIEKITTQEYEKEDLKEDLKFETNKIITDSGQIAFQAIVETGGLSIPKNLNDENIKKGIKPGQDVDIHVDSWILFLITDFAFLKGVDLLDIKESFRNFGLSIYDQHLAVWISDKKGNPDIEKMRYYCYEKFGLDFNHGPYVVITTVHPDVRKKNDPFFRLKLYAIDTTRISGLLNTLAIKIIENRINTLGLFIEEKLALLKSHASKTLGLPISTINKIFPKIGT